MLFVHVPSGHFLMGIPGKMPPADPGFRRFNSRHIQKVRAFWLATTDVTNAQFTRFVHATHYRPPQGYRLSDSPIAKEVVGWVQCRFLQQATDPRMLHWSGAKLPVTCVSEQDAAAFCHWLGQTTGRPYRLPTAAELLYARHCGHDTGPKSAQGKHVLAYAWLSENSGGHPHAVGTRLPDALGLYDMLGNVGMWTGTLVPVAQMDRSATGNFPGAVVVGPGYAGSWHHRQDFIISGPIPWNIRWPSRGFRVACSTRP
jgi:formylglycine-generating enzyme required for sulfatase activity